MRGGMGGMGGMGGIVSTDAPGSAMTCESPTLALGTTPRLPTRAAAPSLRGACACRGEGVCEQAP